MTKINLNLNLEVDECPFCGESPYLHFEGMVLGGVRIILSCPNGCAEKKYDMYYPTLLTNFEKGCREAAKKWNTRMR